MRWIPFSPAYSLEAGSTGLAPCSYSGTQPRFTCSAIPRVIFSTMWLKVPQDRVCVLSSRVKKAGKRGKPPLFKTSPFGVSALEVECQCCLMFSPQTESEIESVSYSVMTIPCDLIDCSPPGSSVHGILQARILEWVAISFSRGSSQPRDRTRLSHIAGRLFTHWATREAL